LTLSGAGFWRGSVKADLIASLIVTSVLDHFDFNFDTLNLKVFGGLYLPVVDINLYSSYHFKNQICKISVNSAEETVEIFFKGFEDTLKIFNQFRYIAQVLPRELSSCLTVAGYAWDGNSYPGNEYWKDSLSSFDSTAIFCSNLGQFQNPEVNVNLADAERIKIY
jgi:hypothetical protein